MTTRKGREAKHTPSRSLPMRSAKRSKNVGHRRRDNVVVPVYWVADKSSQSSGGP